MYTQISRCHVLLYSCYDMKVVPIENMQINMYISKRKQSYIYIHIDTYLYIYI